MVDWFETMIHIEIQRSKSKTSRIPVGHIMDGCFGNQFEWLRLYKYAIIRNESKLLDLSLFDLSIFFNFTVREVNMTLLSFLLLKEEMCSSNNFIWQKTCEMMKTNAYFCS